MNTKYRSYYEIVLQSQSGISYREQLSRIHKTLDATCSFEAFYVGFKRYKKAKAKLKIQEVKPTKASTTNAFSSLLSTLKPDPNPLRLPASRESVYSAFKLPKTANDILLLSDIHVPYHNIEALTLALKYGMEHQVNTIILNGDLIDFYAISRFEKDPRKRDLAHEVNTCREFLTTLRK